MGTETVHSSFKIKVNIIEYTEESKTKYKIDYEVEPPVEEVDFPLSVRMHDGWAIQILLDEKSPPSAMVHTRTCRWVRKR